MAQAFSLPDFTRWLSEQSLEFGTTTWLPVETKGARLLDAALLMAKTLDVPLAQRVLYRHALDYLRSDQLETELFSIVDDATNTGQAIQICAAALDEARGVQRPTQHLTCYTYDDAVRSARARALHVKAFRHARNRADYDRHAYEIARTVIARGDTPEVDHVALEARIEVPAEDIIRNVGGHLSDIFEFSDSDEHRRNIRYYKTPAGTVSCTVDLSTMPAVLGLGTGSSQTVQAEGVIKLRLFADSNSETVRIVPMAYPKVIDSMLAPEQRYDRTWADREFDGWVGDRPPAPGLVLLSATQEHVHPSIALYRAVQLTLEMQLLDFAYEALRRAGYALDLHVGPSVERLFGPAVGQQVAHSILGRIAVVGATTRDDRDRDFDRQAQFAPVLAMPVATAGLEQATTVGNYLRRVYDQVNDGLDKSERHRAGATFSQIKQNCLDHPDDLQASEALDVALSLMSVSPFTARVVDTQVGLATTSRFYKANETSRQIHAAANYAGQFIGLIAHALGREMNTTPLPASSLRSYVGILESQLRQRQANLTVFTSPQGLDVCFELQAGGLVADNRSFLSTHNVYFEYLPESDSILPSDEFLRRYASRQEPLEIADSNAGESALNQIERSTSAVHRIVADLARHSEQLDSEPLSHEGLALLWALSARGHLGFDHIVDHLQLALYALLEPIEVLMKRGAPRPTEPISSVATRHLEQARGLLTDILPLRSIALANDRLSAIQPMYAERRLLDKLNTSLVAHAYERVVESCCDLVEAVVQLTSMLLENTRRQTTLALQSSSFTALQAASPTAVVDELQYLQMALLTAKDGLPISASLSQIRTLEAAATDVQRIILDLDLGIGVLAAPFELSSDALRASPRPFRNVSRDVTILNADVRNSTDLVPEPGAISPMKTINRIMRTCISSFGGQVCRHQEGDDIVAAFADPGSALLAAMMLQEQINFDPNLTGVTSNHGVRVLLHYGEATFDERGDATSQAINESYHLSNEQLFKTHATPNSIYLTAQYQSECPAVFVDSLRSGQLRIPRKDGQSRRGLSDLETELGLSNYADLLSGAVRRFRSRYALPEFIPVIAIEEDTGGATDGAS